MATTTLGDIIMEIQSICRDENGRAAINDADLIQAQLWRSVAYVQMQTDSTPSLVASFLSLTTATGYGPYTVSSTYSDVVLLSQFRETTNGRTVTRVDLPTLLSMRSGTTVDTGPPEVVAFDEQSDGTLKAYVHPDPDQSYTVEGLVALPLSADSDMLSSGNVIYTEAISFPGNTRRAVTHHAAGMLMASVKADYAKLLLDTCETFIAGENKRLKSLRRAGTVLYRNSF